MGRSIISITILFKHRWKNQGDGKWRVHWRFACAQPTASEVRTHARSDNKSAFITIHPKAFRSFDFRSLNSFHFLSPPAHRLTPPSSKCVPLFGSALLFSTAFFNLRPGLTTITGTGECNRQYLWLKIVELIVIKQNLETLTHLLTLPMLTLPNPCCTIEKPRPETKPKRLLPRVPTTRVSGR